MFCNLLAVVAGTFPFTAGTTEAPTLAIERLSGNKVALSWSTNSSSFHLEQTDDLGPGASWQGVANTPDTQGALFRLTLDMPVATRFFRLQSGNAAPLTSLVRTSPANGDNGVAVTRETIFEFSAPLAADTVVTTNEIQATFGGKRLLSRPELSSDRRKISLFYLQNLPSSARVMVSLNGGNLRDASGQAVDGDGDGAPGGMAEVFFDTFSASPVPKTVVVGHVYASELIPDPTDASQTVNLPLEGVIITVDGAENDPQLRAVTDTNGFFRIDPAPAGPFFVHVDGRLAKGSQWPGGAYYPFVGKAWSAMAGTTNLAGGTGEIFLPLIPQGTLQPVSATQPTSITFASSVTDSNPALTGVSITVPPNSLFSDNGTRGGMVGIAPVSPDRLPSPLPPGVNFPMVITVQTDGPLNFDVPAPITFPNLPDPVTGKKLPPGAKSALWSFNHDTGDWEIVGPMTVSADGNYVTTDPGVGIKQPGWHGTQPGTSGSCDNIRRRGGSGGGGGGGGGGGDGGDGGDGSPPDCEEPCDDGDPCTMNDRCQNGVCMGDIPGGPECGPNTPAPVDQSNWPTTNNDADPGGNYTTHKGFTILGDICYDRAAQGWAFRASSLQWKGAINTSLSGSMEPVPMDGGNVTMANYCAIIAEMAGYLGRGRGTWHLRAASLAHEVHHRDVDWPGIGDPLWQAAEMALEAVIVPCDTDPADAQTFLAQKVSQAQANLESQFASQLATYNAGHDSARNDGAYQAGQAVLDGMIQQIRNYASSKGWPACPAGSLPDLAQGRRLQRQGFPVVKLTATAALGVLDVGQTTQIQVQGVYADGSTVDLTSAANGTLYSTTDSGIVTVSPGGLVSGAGSGIATVIVSYFPEVDEQPLLAAVKFTVPWPTDRDNDGMPDAWELAHGLNPNDPKDATRDSDGDGVMNVREFELATDPQNPDSDGDGMNDHAEILAGTNPRHALSENLIPSLGLHYFVLMNLETGLIEQRGITGRNGLGHNNLIMAPNARYRQWIFHPASGLIGSAEWITPNSGQTFLLPAVVLHRDDAADDDGDGLSDLAEFVLGTDAHNPDTDNDGVADGAEVEAGTNPSDGLPVQTGVIANADTPGNAVDVAAVNGYAAVADSSAGVAIFNIQSGFNPTLISEVDTPGMAQAVALINRPTAQDVLRVAVADGASGLAVVDLELPANARITQQVNLGGTANSVATLGGLAYVGLESGKILVVDTASGAITERLDVSQRVNDLAISGQTLFVAGQNSLLTFSLDDLGGGALDTINLNFFPEGITKRRRIFVTPQYAYVTSYPGYDVIDVRDPSNLALLGAAGGTGPNSFKQIVDNGSGLGVAAVGVNPRADGTHDVYLYDISDPTDTRRYLTTLLTPGLAYALSIYNGLAYVADGDTGLQVVNYLPYDTGNQPPSITLSADFPLNPAQAEEGKLVDVLANVSDDVQVARVEFYINGVRFSTDGNFPFETRFYTPLLAIDRTNFTLRARAIDTGGNGAWSTEYTVTLVPDATAPRVIRRFPTPGSIVGSADTVAAYFSEPIDTATLAPNAFQVVFAGPDATAATSDDTVVGGGTVDYRNILDAAFLRFPAPLEPGLYTVYVRPPIADRAGNPLAAEVSWNFWVLGQVDTDNDGVPDNVETALGLDPNNADSDGDGILDGQEDIDKDRLPTAWELLFGYDPRVADTDLNGVRDDMEDADSDGLINYDEARLGTNPMNGDSDGDGYDDNGEYVEGTDPASATSRPTLVVVSTAATFLNAVPAGAPAGTAIDIQSLPAAYLNAFPEAPPAGTTVTPVSLPVSYLNAVPEPYSGPVLQVSPVVSYRNQ